MFLRWTRWVDIHSDCFDSCFPSCPFTFRHWHVACSFNWAAIDIPVFNHVFRGAHSLLLCAVIDSHSKGLFPSLYLFVFHISLFASCSLPSQSSDDGDFLHSTCSFLPFPSIKKVNSSFLHFICFFHGSIIVVIYFVTREDSILSFSITWYSRFHPWDIMVGIFYNASQPFLLL